LVETFIDEVTAADSVAGELRASEVKAHSAGRAQNRLHVQKAFMEYLLLGHDVH
jgi:hypothetical protein